MSGPRPSSAPQAQQPEPIDDVVDDLDEAGPPTGMDEGDAPFEEEVFDEEWQPIEGDGERDEEYTPLSGWWAEVRYDSADEAERALDELQGSDLNGFPLSVLQEEDGKLVFENLPPGTDWRDLKDICRKIGNVVHVDVHEPPFEEPETCVGEIRMERAEDAEAAVKALTETEFRGRKITCEIDPDEDGGRFLRIFNLPYGTAWQAIKDLFAVHGRVAFAGIEGEDYSKGKGKGKKGKKGKDKGKGKGKESRKGKKGSGKGFSSAPKSGKGYDSGKGKSKGKGRSEPYNSRPYDARDGGSWDRRDESRSRYDARPGPSSAGSARPSGAPRAVFSSGAVPQGGKNAGGYRSTPHGGSTGGGRAPAPSAAPQYASAPRGDSRPRSRPPPRRADSRRRSRSRGRGMRGGGNGGVKTGEIRFEASNAAEWVDTAIRQYDGINMGGNTITVERDPKSDVKLYVRNLPPHVGWPELKDMFKKVGTVAFADTR